MTREFGIKSNKKMSGGRKKQKKYVSRGATVTKHFFGPYAMPMHNILYLISSLKLFV